MTNFAALDLIEPLQRALASEGYTAPTPVQAKSIPSLLSGRDLLGVAQTGTGKTAAFTLPMLQHLAAPGARPRPGKPRALVLTPTRELANQIGDSARVYGRHLRLRTAVVLGGVPIGRQIKALSAPVDILIATPGRLLDLMNQRKVALDAVEFFVLDEADRMLDLGFVNDVRKIAGRIPADHQTALFSATMPKAVAALAEGLLRDPERVEIAPPSTTAERIEQHVLFVAKSDKNALLAHLLGDAAMARVLVFTRTKRGADRVTTFLERRGIGAAAIHGNKAQNARERALAAFKSGKVQALVATDIAARGIDVDGVTHVVNVDMPNDPESYVHRIGRTARAGADGIAFSFCDGEERALLAAVEKNIRLSIPVLEAHPFHDAAAAALRAPMKPKKPGRSRGYRGGKPKGDTAPRQAAGDGERKAQGNVTPLPVKQKTGPGAKKPRPAGPRRRHRSRNQARAA